MPLDQRNLFKMHSRRFELLRPQPWELETHSLTTRTKVPICFKQPQLGLEPRTSRFVGGHSIQLSYSGNRFLKQFHDRESNPDRARDRREY